MLKLFLIPLVSMSFLYANEAPKAEDAEMIPPTVCEKKYNECADACEAKADQNNLRECYSKCETLYDECEAKLNSQPKK